MFIGEGVGTKFKNRKIDTGGCYHLENIQNETSSNKLSRSLHN